MFELDQNIEEIVSEIMNSDDEVGIEEVLPTEEINVEEIIEDDVLVETIEVPVMKFKLGDAVCLKSDAVYVTNTKIAAAMFNTKLYVRKVSGDTYAVATTPNSRASGMVAGKYLLPYTEEIAVQEDNSYIGVIRESVDIKSRPTVDSKTLKTLEGGLFTITEEKNGWGHLKIGGWVPLDTVKKFGE